MLEKQPFLNSRKNKVVKCVRKWGLVFPKTLWYNALMIMSIFAEKFGDDYEYYNDLASKVYKSFNEKFYCEETGCLYDTVDPYDKSVRPNQVWVLSLPFKLLPKEKAMSVFKVVEGELYNKYGLRSLSPKDPRFKPRYEGKLFDRDMAYHMGTTWGFLIGGYLDAYRYVHGDGEEVTEKINELVHVFSVRNNKESVFKTKIFNNTKLLLAIAVSALLMLVILFVPALREVFSIPVLPKDNIIEIVLIVLSPLVIVEFMKLIKCNGTKGE
jgi:hypothetical protein